MTCISWVQFWGPCKIICIAPADLVAQAKRLWDPVKQWNAFAGAWWVG